jgi:hypothetical protein
VFEALKARNRRRRPEFAVVALPTPGPMAEAFIFRAFGAGKKSFDTGPKLRGYYHSSAERTDSSTFCAKQYGVLMECHSESEKPSALQS